MKNIFFFYFVIILILTQSCIFKNNPDVKIKNESDYLIDSVILSAHPNSKKTVFKNIKPNETRKGNILFDNVPKTDGASSAVLYFNNKIKRLGLGYYTNGASLDYGFDIVIENDTVIVNHY